MNLGVIVEKAEGTLNVNGTTTTFQQVVDSVLELLRGFGHPYIVGNFDPDVMVPVTLGVGDVNTIELRPNMDGSVSYQCIGGPCHPAYYRN